MAKKTYQMLLNSYKHKTIHTSNSIVCSKSFINLILINLRLMSIKCFRKQSDLVTLKVLHQKEKQQKLREK